MISLDNAIRLLVGEVGEGGDRLRARGRRLYDIANVLTSLGLVRRIPAAKAFQYVGPSVDPIVNDEDTFGILQRNSLLPSRHVNNVCRENVTMYGDHEVTPSEVPPPVQKRGRPRKLATAFTTSTLPAPKRSKLQRTRSEDVISSQSRKMTRNPSLHDICQAAEVERERLMKEQQSYRSRSSDGFESGCGRAKKACAVDKNMTLPNSDFRPISSAPSPSTGILQHRLTKRTKIPVALTFQGSEGRRSSGGDWFQNSSYSVQDIKQNIIIKSQDYKVVENQKSGSVTCHYPKPLRGAMGNKLLLDMRKSSVSTGTSTPNNHQPLSEAQPIAIVHPFSNQNQKNQVHQNKEPVVIVRGNSLGSKTYSQSRVVPVCSSVSQGAQVIKVITKTTASKQQDASTIMTVLPANPVVKGIATKPKQIIRNSSGSFQQMCEGTYANGQRVVVTSSDSGCVSGNAIPVIEVKPSSSFVVFTVSDNQAGQRTLSRMANGEDLATSFRQPYSIQQLGAVRIGEHFSPSGISSLTSAPLRQDRNGNQQQQILVDLGNQCHQRTTASGLRNNLIVNNTTWQPSPDGSSTDSEFETDIW